MSYDANQKISSIRLHWDQGSLLKQVEVIGARGRNWPIHEGKEQVKLITSIAGTPEASAAPSRRSTQSIDQADVQIPLRSHASSLTSAFASEPRNLSLFETAAPEDESTVSGAGGPIISPRASAKPPSRGLEDILTGGEKEIPPPSEFRSPSPKKQLNGNGGTQRQGAEKHFHPIRLFDENDAPPDLKSPDQMKVDSKKYKHFEFGSGEDAMRLSTKQTNKAKHGSQWDFSDFMTPEKPHVAKVRTQDTRNFGWSDDEVQVTHGIRDLYLNRVTDMTQDKSPVRRAIVHHARPDAETHFEFVDDGTPVAVKPRPSSKGRQHNDGLGLYRDNVLDPEGAEDAAKGGKKPLTTTSVNVNADSRHRDFDSQFEMIDDSPSVSRIGAKDENAQASAQPPKKIDENRAKVLKMMSSSWQTFDDADDTSSSKKENVPAGPSSTEDKAKGIKTAGSGVGGRRDAERHWGFGEDDDFKEEETKKIVPSGQQQGAEVKSFWDF